ncbi:hypothetical protein [Methanogenium cariaci]|uniref:hypothetical protein n=1 Tax=Methanogenium cariaci TaxID=2197 RepID=UPI0012F6D35C|nr:hypothetical protein [Methanogenium cariaci]
MVNIIVTKCAPQNISVGEENNQDIVPVAMQEEIKISLPENPLDRICLERDCG